MEAQSNRPHVLQSLLLTANSSSKKPCAYASYSSFAALAGGNKVCEYLDA